MGTLFNIIFLSFIGTCYVIIDFPFFSNLIEKQFQAEYHGEFRPAISLIKCLLTFGIIHLYVETEAKITKYGIAILQAFVSGTSMGPENQTLVSSLMQGSPILVVIIYYLYQELRSKEESLWEMKADEIEQTLLNEDEEIISEEETDEDEDLLADERNTKLPRNTNSPPNAKAKSPEAKVSQVETPTAKAQIRNVSMKTPQPKQKVIEEEADEQHASTPRKASPVVDKVKEEQAQLLKQRTADRIRQLRQRKAVGAK